MEADHSSETSTNFYRITRSYIPGGRAIPQVVSRRLYTAEAWVRSRVKSCGVLGGQSGIEDAP